MEVVHLEPPVMLDGAHNPAGAAALAAALREEFPTTVWTLVVGAMSDKDLSGILVPLRGLVVAVHACAADTPRARPAGDVADAARAMFGDDVPVVAHSSVGGALSAARRDEASVLVTGSLAVVGAARATLDVD
jgi:dihydrofolate synthase/folylpolyglutamate synthase